MWIEFTQEIDNWDGVSELDIDSEEYKVFDVEVRVRFSEYVPERMYLSNGDPGYPAEGGEIEEFEIVDMDGKDVYHEVQSRFLTLLEEQAKEKYTNSL